MTTSIDRKTIKADLMFGLLGIGSVALIVLESTADRPAIAIPDSPALMVGATLALIIAFAFLVTRLIRIDQRKFDEYVFGIIGRAAIVAVVTTIFCHAVLGQGFLLGGVFGKMSADSLLGVLNASWAAGYFFYRIRGTTA